jgi:hypothetical protein
MRVTMVCILSAASAAHDDQYPRLAPPPPELPPPKLLPPELPDEDDELDCARRGSTLVYSLVNVQKAHFSSTSALPVALVVAALITLSVDDFVLFEHCGHLSYELNHFAYRSVSRCEHAGHFHTS